MDPEPRCMDPIEHGDIRASYATVCQTVSSASEGVRGRMPHNAQRLLD